MTIILDNDNIENAPINVNTMEHIKYMIPKGCRFYIIDKKTKIITKNR
jgi:hypothetical protein